MSVQRPPQELIRQVLGWNVATLWEELVDFIERELGARMTSWYRTPAHNAQVGGHARSQHLIGLAIDLVWPNPRDRAAGLEVLRSFGLTVVEEGSHDHVQMFPAGLLERLGVFSALARWFE